MPGRETLNTSGGIMYIIAKGDGIAYSDLFHVKHLIDEMIDELGKLDDYHDEILSYGLLKERIEKHAKKERLKLLSPVPDEFLTRLHQITHQVSDRWWREYGFKEIIFAEDDAVLNELRHLVNRLKDPEQRIISSEALRCAQCGAFRAAMVMTWNLTFEFLRRWIFLGKRKRLAAFNAELTARNRTANTRHDPIIAFEDFHHHNEAFILEVAYSAKLYKKQQNQILTHSLTERNHFAHPTARGATKAGAMGYVDTLLRNVLLHPRFAMRRKQS